MCIIVFSLLEATWIAVDEWWDEFPSSA